MKKASLLSVVGISIFTLLFAGQASAAGQGPRASLASATTCALHLGGPGSGDASLMVTTTLTNMSSGGVIPEVTSATLDGTYKPKNQGGNVNITFDSETFVNQGVVNPTKTISASFPLCAAADLAGNVVLDVARELNGKSTVNYQISGDGGLRTVTNQCTDNPATPENEGGIKVADVLALIEAACGF